MDPSSVKTSNRILSVMCSAHPCASSWNFPGLVAVSARQSHSYGRTLQECLYVLVLYRVLVLVLVLLFGGNASNAMQLGNLVDMFW